MTVPAAPPTSLTVRRRRAFVGAVGVLLLLILGVTLGPKAPRAPSCA